VSTQRILLALPPFLVAAVIACSTVRSEESAGTASSDLIIPRPPPPPPPTPPFRPVPAVGPLQTYGDAPAIAQSAPANAQYDVLTQHNDLARTGAATHEDILTPASVAQGFGLIGAPVPVSGKIYAQPLYVEQAAMACNGSAVKNANIAYVATLTNTIYAIDVDAGAVCWERWVACGQDADGLLGFNVNLSEGTGAVSVGIVSTPVVDIAQSVLYVVTREWLGAPATHFFVNTLDTRTGALVGRTELTGVEAPGDCGGNVFVPGAHNNRPGLLLVDHELFVGFGSTIGEDAATPYHGFVFGFDVGDPSNPVPLPHAFCSTPDGVGGGVWMSGAGLASDGSSLYLLTGNGAYPEQTPGGPPVLPPSAGTDPGPAVNNFPDSFVKIPLVYFRQGAASPPVGYTDTRSAQQLPAISPPPNQPASQTSQVAYGLTIGGANLSIFWAREYADADLGSGGALLVGNQLVGGGKDGILYLLNAADMSPVQSFQAFVDADNMLGLDPGYSTSYSFALEYYAGPNIHGGPIAWDVSSRGGPATAYVYGWSEKDSLKRFEIDGHAFNPAPNATPWNPTPSPHGDVMSSFKSMPGGMLSLSSNGAQNGIVWATLEEPYPSVGVVDKRCGIGVAANESCGGCMVGPTFSTFVEYCDASQGYVPGRLYAFAADDDGRGHLPRLWGDKSVPAGTTPNNAITRYAKFTPPTVAHGKVLVGTGNGQLLIYGLTHSPARSRRPDDLMAVWDYGGYASFALFPSTGPTQSFAPGVVWAAQDGGFPGSVWMPGDFDGDGLADVGAAWPNSYVPNGPLNGLAIRRTTGGSSPYETTSQWAGQLSADRSTWIPGGDQAWVNGALWVSGDYDGDGRTDVAWLSPHAPLVGSNEAVSCTVFRAASNGQRFEKSFLWSIDGGWMDPPNVSWLSGDFDGDGRSDLVSIWNDGGANTLSVALSNRSAFAPLTHWLHQYGTYFTNTKWLAGDFDGDGLTDIASAAQSGSLAVFTIFRSTGTSFTPVYVGTPDGGWGDGVKMVTGDFDADGKADIAAVWNGGSNAIVVRRSNGVGLNPATSWMQPGINYGGWMDSTVWVSGKFRPGPS
jgi:hypothetical protein